MPIKYAETLGSGLAFCLVFDSIFPNVLPMHKIKTKPRFRHEFLLNFKMLNYGFGKMRLEYEFPLEQLTSFDSKANLDLLFFLKKQFDAKPPQPLEQKEKERLKDLIVESAKKIEELGFIRGHPGSKIKIDEMTKNSGMEVENVGAEENPQSNLKGAAGHEEENKKKLKGERDFYYGKLRDIDHYLDVFDKDMSVETLAKYIRDIIYSMPEQEVTIEEDGGVTVRRKEKDGSN